MTGFRQDNQLVVGSPIRIIFQRNVVAGAHFSIPLLTFGLNNVNLQKACHCSTERWRTLSIMIIVEMLHLTFKI